MTTDTFKDTLVAKHSELSRYLAPKSSVREGLTVEHQADELDNIQSRQQREDSMDFIRRSQSTMVRVKSALGRMESGEYGICLSCDEQIGPARLKAIPWAEYCISCQEKIDSSDQDITQEDDSTLAL